VPVDGGAAGVHETGADQLPRHPGGQTAAGALAPTPHYAKVRRLIEEKQDVSVYVNVERAFSLFLKTPVAQINKGLFTALAPQDLKRFRSGASFVPTAPWPSTRS
jgi:hypothetical protein